MAQLSRTKKYQQLREQIDEDTTAAQVQPVKPQPRLSRVQNHSLSHATKPLHSHEETPTQSRMTEFQTSPVMDELLGEVKQYNIDNGTRITDDTQINILRQLETPQEPKKRSEHFLPMDEDEDEGGTTMKLPKSLKDDPSISSFMAAQKLTRINPIRFDEEEEEVVETVEPTEKIVLSSNDIRADEHAETDQLSVLSVKQEEASTESSASAAPAAAKKKKKKKGSSKKSVKTSSPVKKTSKVVEDDMPSAKMRMRAEDFENDLPEKAKKKSNDVLNIVLIVLIILLIASIGLTIYFVHEMGVL